jgi:hypothetical protein
LTDDAPAPATPSGPAARKAVPIFLGALGLVVLVGGVLVVVAVRGLTGAGPTPAEAQAATHASAPAASHRSAQAGWPLELVQQGNIPAPDMSGRPVLFNDNFAESNNGFWVGTAEGNCKQSSYRAGRLRITSLGPGEWWFWPLPGEKRYSDFACEFVGRVLRPGSAWACMLHGPEGRAARVSIDSDGVLHVQPITTFREPWSEETGPLNRTFQHRAIKPRGEANALLCIVRGRHLELYVNGVAVQNPINFDRDLTPTWVSYCILGGADGGEIEFERITVWSVTDLPPADARGLPVK